MSEAKGAPEKGKNVSRRDFLKHSAAGASVAAVTMGTVRNVMGAADEAASDLMYTIRIAPDALESLKQDPSPATFEGRGMSGAQVFAKACVEEGLAAMFCCPGNYGMINAIAAEGIPTYGGRCEGNMTSAADGFCRVTGEVAACSGTEGPGFTNMIMNIGAANAARSPILVIASNMAVRGDDTEGRIQQAYQQPTTEGMKKYGKRLIDPNRVYEYAGYAFRQLKTGVPGPVHLDFPSEVAGARFAAPGDIHYYNVGTTEKRYDKTRYRTDAMAYPSPKEVAKAVDMIKKAQRPMIVAGSGVFYKKAWDELKRLAEKAEIAVIETGPQRGHFGDEHRLSANLGFETSNSADLVIFVGQYCMPPFGQMSFSAEADFIRIHPDGLDIGRNWPIDLGIIADEKGALEALAEAVAPQKRETWVDELAAARKQFEADNDDYYKQGLALSEADHLIHPAVIAKELGDFLYKGDLPKEQTTVVSGGYGIGRYTRRYTRAFRPGQILNGAYQYGAIGPDVGYTVGAGAAVQQGVGPQAPYKGHPVIGITGDAGIAYSAMEFDTLGKYKIPAVMIVYNNNAWGVWSTGARATRAFHMYLFQENLRYDKIAEALGGRGEYITSAADFAPALKRSYEIAAAEGVSTLINCQGKKEYWQGRPGMLRSVEPGITAYNH